MVVDIGKCKSKSWQVLGLRKEILRHPGMKFVLCHLLGPGGRQEEELKTALDQLALPNVWFDLSSVVHNCRDVQDPWNRAAEYVRLARDLA